MEELHNNNQLSTIKSKKFDKILMRLKAQLKISQNKEVSSMLGISYDGFYARRQRDSFPEEKLRILSEQRPELQLNVDYILTGIPAAKRYAIEQTAATYPIPKKGVDTLDDADWEQFCGDKVQANKLVDCILEEIGFPQARTALRMVIAELLQSNSMTPAGAKALLILLKEDFESNEERIQNARLGGLTEKAQLEIQQARTKLKMLEKLYDQAVAEMEQLKKP